MTLKAIIFDVDGTLAETEDVHRQSFNRAFEEFGHDWNWDVPSYKALLRVTGGKNRIRLYLEESHRAELSRPDLDDYIAALHARKTVLYSEILAEGDIELRPGVEGLIDEARVDGLTLAIATTTTPANIEALLGATLGTEALSWFSAIGNAQSAPTLKPDPAVYLWVLDQLGLGASDCLAIEDSGNGIQSALAAGVPCLVVKSAFTQTGDTTGALGPLETLAGTCLSDLKAMHGEYTEI